MLEIRKARPGEGQIIYDLSGSVNWNHSLEECEMLVSNPDCEVILAVKDGVIAGSAGSVRYDKNGLFYINMVIVKPEFRKMGLASAMIEYYQEHYGHFACFRLHATPAGSPVYQRLGFEFKRQISCFTAHEIDVSALPDVSVRQLELERYGELLAFDRKNFGYDRKFVFDFNLKHYGNLAFEAKNRGFVLGRSGRNYRQISALQAYDLTAASGLLKKTASQPGQKALSIAVYDYQSEFQAMLLRCGFVKVREMFDMEYGKNGVVPSMQYYAVYGGDKG